MITEEMLSKLELKPGDIIILKGDWNPEAAEEIANKTKHFVVWLDTDSSFETMSREEFLGVIEAYEKHLSSGGE